MALPSTGSISLSQINTELGRSSTSTVSLNTAEDGGYVAINACSAIRPLATNPASMSEWRGYDHAASCGVTGYCGVGGKGLIELNGPGSTTHTITVGNGPGLFRVRVGTYGVWPGTFPTSATGTPAAWWRSRVTVTGTSYDVLWAGDGLIGTSGYFNDVEVDNQTYYNEYYTYIPAGSNQVTFAVETYSPNLFLKYAYHVTCITPGSIVGLHWSYDNSSNACNPNYVYSFDTGDGIITGFSGYLNFLVSGNGTLSVGNKIYVYPSGSAASTPFSTNAYISGGSAWGYTGGLSYVFPSYNGASPLSGQTKASVSSYPNSAIPLLAADGYYSDGTNWALMSGGIITTTGTCTVPVYIVGDVIGSNSEQVRFRSRLTDCNGALVNTGCQIDITYSWSDVFFGSGTGSATIVPGGTQTIVTPSGDPIGSFNITSATFNGGSCTGYTISICGEQV